jgi:hypothetical protein
VSLFGPAGDQVEIVVPPNPDTVRILVNPDLSVSVSPCSSSVIVLRRHSLIRFKPTLHACALFALSPFQPLSLRGWSFGLKFRPVEIGRFGLAAYACLSPVSGPPSSVAPAFGPGLDFRLIGNLSADAAYLWGLQTANCKLQTPALYLGLSLRL